MFLTSKSRKKPGRKKKKLGNNAAVLKRHVRAPTAAHRSNLFLFHFSYQCSLFRFEPWCGNPVKLGNHLTNNRQPWTMGRTLEGDVALLTCWPVSNDLGEKNWWQIKKWAQVETNRHCACWVGSENESEPRKCSHQQWEREREMSLLGLHYFLQVKGTRRKRVNRLVSIVCVCVCVCLLVIERIRKRIGGRITRERKATPQSGASAGRVIDAFSLAGRPGWPVPSSAWCRPTQWPN